MNDPKPLFKADRASEWASPPRRRLVKCAWCGAMIAANHYAQHIRDEGWDAGVQEVIDALVRFTPRNHHEALEIIQDEVVRDR